MSTTISPQALSKLLAEQPDLNLIDVRTPVEFAQVHVAQARLEPLDKFNAAAVAKDKPVYLLCRSGARASKAAEALEAAGHTQAVVVEGGTLGWIDAELPVERGTSNVISLERQVRIAAGSIVLTGVLLAHFVNPAFIWLSGFIGAGLVFAGISDWCGMGLLIAKAPWNQKA
jgi:rhodanese-related sulfurtransferase